MEKSLPQPLQMLVALGRAYEQGAGRHASGR